MKLLESFLVSFGALRANKLRALLTVSGIVIGVFLIFVMLSVGGGSVREAKKMLADLPPNSIIVVSGNLPMDVSISKITLSPSEMLQQMENMDAGIPLLSSKLQPKMEIGRAHV